MRITNNHAYTYIHTRTHTHTHTNTHTNKHTHTHTHLDTGIALGGLSLSLLLLTGLSVGVASDWVDSVGRVASFADELVPLALEDADILTVVVSAAFVSSTGFVFVAEADGLVVLVLLLAGCDIVVGDVPTGATLTVLELLCLLSTSSDDFLVVSFCCCDFVFSSDACGVCACDGVLSVSVCVSVCCVCVLLVVVLSVSARVSVLFVFSFTSTLTLIAFASFITFPYVLSASNWRLCLGSLRSRLRS